MLSFDTENDRTTSVFNDMTIILLISIFLLFSLFSFNSLMINIQEARASQTREFILRKPT